MCKPYHVIGDIGSAVASMISGCRHKNFPLHPFITFRDDNQLFEEMANHSRSSNIKNTSLYPKLFICLGPLIPPQNHPSKRNIWI